MNKVETFPVLENYPKMRKLTKWHDKRLIFSSSYISFAESSQKSQSSETTETTQTIETLIPLKNENSYEKKSRNGEKYLFLRMKQKIRYNMKKLLSIAMMAMLSVAAFAQEENWTTIQNGIEWTDTEGYIVQAHGGNFLHHGDKWFLVGEDRSGSWMPDVNLYSTEDFVHWKFEAKIIKNFVTHEALGSSRMIERPKLMWNEKTKKFVVWCHWEARNYSASEAAVFESDDVAGPYECVWAGRPCGTKSRDCNVFVDNDGKAYFISTTDENTNLGLFELSDNYHEALSKTPMFEGMRREAPAIVHIGDTYYMISSACTGWDPNQAKIATSKDIKSGWTELENIGDKIAFDTQASSILTIKGTEGTVYIYVGDRWMDPDLPRSKIIMLPIEWKDGKMELNYYDKWQIDFKRGVWRKL